MGMGANYVIECEENFFGAAQDIVHEFETFSEFYNKMMTQKDLVKHMSSSTVAEYLSEIWYG